MSRHHVISSYGRHVQNWLHWTWRHHITCEKLVSVKTHTLCFLKEYCAYIGVQWTLTCPNSLGLTLAKSSLWIEVFHVWIIRSLDMVCSDMWGSTVHSKGLVLQGYVLTWVYIGNHAWETSSHVPKYRSNLCMRFYIVFNMDLTWLCLIHRRASLLHAFTWVYIMDI